MNYGDSMALRELCQCENCQDMRELERYREREPLVQELLEVATLTSCGWFECNEAALACIRYGAPDVASEANAAASSGAEPTK